MSMSIQHFISNFEMHLFATTFILHPSSSSVKLRRRSFIRSIPYLPRPESITCTLLQAGQDCLDTCLEYCYGEIANESVQGILHFIIPMQISVFVRKTRIKPFHSCIGVVLKYSVLGDHFQQFFTSKIIQLTTIHTLCGLLSRTLRY